MSELKTVDEMMVLANEFAHAVRVEEGQCASTDLEENAIRAELEKWQKRIDELVKANGQAALDLDVITEEKAILQAEIESINKIHKFDMDNMFKTLNATHEMNKKKELIFMETVVELQAEIDRLTKPSSNKYDFWRGLCDDKSLAEYHIGGELFRTEISQILEDININRNAFLGLLESTNKSLAKLKTEVDTLRNDMVNSGELYLEEQIQLRHADEKIADLLNEVGRLNAIIKANGAMDFCLQITAQNKELRAENKELQDKLTDSMWDVENERTNRELVEDECDKLAKQKAELLVEIEHMAD